MSSNNAAAFFSPMPEMQAISALFVLAICAREPVWRRRLALSKCKVNGDQVAKRFTWTVESWCNCEELRHTIRLVELPLKSFWTFVGESLEVLDVRSCFLKVKGDKEREVQSAAQDGERPRRVFCIWIVDVQQHNNQLQARVFELFYALFDICPSVVVVLEREPENTDIVWGLKIRRYIRNLVWHFCNPLKYWIQRLLGRDLNIEPWNWRCFFLFLDFVNLIHDFIEVVIVEIIFRHIVIDRMSEKLFYEWEFFLEK